MAHPSGNYTAQAIRDEELVEQVKQLDPRAFERLFARYSGYIRSQVKKQQFHNIDSDDLMQECTIGFLKAVRSYDPAKGASFRTWASLCIKRRISTYFQTVLRQKNLPLQDYIPLDDLDQQTLLQAQGQRGQQDPQNLYEDREDLQDITKQLQSRLSVLERQTLMLYLNGYPYSEMAKRLGCTPKAVDNALQRVRRKLKRLKKPFGNDV